MQPSATHHPTPAQTPPELSQPGKISPDLRQAILKRTTELQNRIPRTEQTPARVLPLYLEAATEIVDELPGKVNPLRPPEKILLFLIHLQNRT